MAGMRALTPTELGLLLAALEDRPRDRTLILLGCHTGFRVSELLGLSVGHVAQGSTIRAEVILARSRLKGGKGKHARSVTSRRVVLTQMARTALADYLSRRFSGPCWSPEAPLFPSRKGPGPLLRGHAWKIIRRAADAVGIPGPIGTHTMRKTMAARIYSVTGHDLLKTQRILGHRHVTTTAAYLDTPRESLDEAVRALDQIEICQRVAVEQVCDAASFER